MRARDLFSTYMHLRPFSPLLVSLVAALQFASCANDAGQGEEQIPPITEPPAVAETPQTEGDGAAGTITVDPSTKYQTIDGFGTTMGMFDSPHLNGVHNSNVGGISMTQAEKDTIYDLLYSRTKGIGLNRLRVHLIEPGWQPEEGARINADMGYPGPTGSAVMEFIRQSKLRNPALLTGFQIGRFDSWINKNTDPLIIARYIKTGLDYARANGHEPDWVGVVNEPTLAPVSFSPEKLRDITIALKNLLAADGYLTRASAPDDVADGAGAPKAAVILADPQARSFLKSLSIHLYTDESPTEMMALSKQYNLPLWMTEYGDGDTRDLMWASNIVHEMLVTYNCAAVDMLFGFIGSTANGAPNASYISLISNGPAYLGYKIASSYYQTGHWSRYVTRGSVRIEAASTNPSIKASAFLVDGKKVIVLINKGGGNEAVTIPAGNFRAIRTQMTGTDRLTDKGLFTSAIVLPRMSITTLIER